MNLKEALINLEKRQIAAAKRLECQDCGEFFPREKLIIDDDVLFICRCENCNEEAYQRQVEAHYG